jgi:hypothetical protein
MTITKTNGIYTNYDPINQVKRTDRATVYACRLIKSDMFETGYAEIPERVFVKEGEDLKVWMKRTLAKSLEVNCNSDKGYDFYVAKQGSDTPSRCYQLRYIQD